MITATLHSDDAVTITTSTRFHSCSSRAVALRRSFLSSTSQQAARQRLIASPPPGSCKRHDKSAPQAKPAGQENRRQVEAAGNKPAGRHARAACDRDAIAKGRFELNARAAVRDSRSGVWLVYARRELQTRQKEKVTNERDVRVRERGRSRKAVALPNHSTRHDDAALKATRCDETAARSGRKTAVHEGGRAMRDGRREKSGERAREKERRGSCKGGGRCRSLLSSERRLSRISHVQKSILVCLLSIDLRHERRARRQRVAHESVDGLVGGKLNALANREQTAERREFELERCRARAHEIAARWWLCEQSEQRACLRQRAYLANHVYELAHGQIGGNEIPGKHTRRTGETSGEQT